MLLGESMEFGMDLSRIPSYHPRVGQVDLISGKQFREAGVSYRCHLSDGKNTCIEKDIEIIPMEKLVTIFLSDTMGAYKIITRLYCGDDFKKNRQP